MCPGKPGRFPLPSPFRRTFFSVSSSLGFLPRPFFLTRLVRSVTLGTHGSSSSVSLEPPTVLKFRIWSPEGTGEIHFLVEIRSKSRTYLKEVTVG